MALGKWSRGHSAETRRLLTPAKTKTASQSGIPSSQPRAYTNTVNPAKAAVQPLVRTIFSRNGEAFTHSKAVLRLLA